jgi:hypothetical protein
MPSRIWRILVSPPGFGFLWLGRGAIALFGWLHGLALGLIYRDIQGRRYAYKNQALDVVDDEAGARWLRVADVRKLLPKMPPDATLQALYGPGVQVLAGRAGQRGAAVLRIQAEALVQHLQSAQDPQALRFKVWLQRAVVHPAQRRQAALSRGS